MFSTVFQCFFLKFSNGFQCSSPLLQCPLMSGMVHLPSGIFYHSITKIPHIWEISRWWYFRMMIFYDNDHFCHWYSVFIYPWNICNFQSMVILRFTILGNTFCSPKYSFHPKTLFEGKVKIQKMKRLNILISQDARMAQITDRPFFLLKMQMTNGKMQIQKCYQWKQLGDGWRPKR